MDIATRITEREQKTKEGQQRAFQNFIGLPETKLMISMVPEATPKESLETLLQSAFIHGHSAGQGEILMEMVSAMLKDKTKS